MSIRRHCLAVVALCAMASVALAQIQAKPLPHFASLKADPVDVRRGPSGSEPALWTFQRAGTPIEVLAIIGAFAQVRDVEGGQGWIPVGAVSGRRTAVVVGAQGDRTALRSDRRDGAAVIAELEGGLVAGVSACDGAWCQLTVGALRGFLPQARIWGVYPGEIIE